MRKVGKSELAVPLREVRHAFGSFAAAWCTVGRGAPARSAGMFAVLLTAHAAAVPRVQRVLAALEADLDALERMQTSAENCDPGNGCAGVMKMALQNCENWRSKLPDQAKAVTPCCVQLIKDAQRNVPSDQRADVLAQLSDYYAKIGTGAGMTWKEALHVLVKFYGSAFSLASGAGAFDLGIWGTIATKGFEKLVELTKTEGSKTEEKARELIEKQTEKEEKVGEYLKEAIKFLTKNGLDVPDELTDNAIDFFIAKRQLIKEAYLEAATQDGASYNAEAEVFDTMFQDLQGIKQSLT